MSVTETTRQAPMRAAAAYEQEPKRLAKVARSDALTRDTGTTSAEKARDRIADVVDKLDSTAQGLVQGATRTVERVRGRSHPAVQGVAELRTPQSASPLSPRGGTNDAMRGVTVMREEQAIQRASKVSKLGGIVGKVAVPVGLALGALDIGFAVRRDGGFGPEATKAVGRVAGGMTGAYLGALAGTALIPIPGVGTAIGAIAGGWLGSVIGEKVAPPIADAVKHAWEGASNLVEDVAEGARDFLGGLFD